MITVKSIVYKPKSEKAGHNLGYLRRPLQEANLVEGYGDELAAQGYPTGPGVLGENIILSGVDLRDLPEGTQLRLGDEAVIALGKPRIPCDQLTPLDARMPETVAGRVGVMCRVVKTGRVKVGDTVEIIAEAVKSL